jgi:hypothetical protein
MEHAVAHGYLMATVKDYARKRIRDRERLDGRGARPVATGQANVAGWQQLARIWTGTLLSGGERLVN